MIQGWEEYDAAHTQEEKARKEAIRTGNDEHPVVQLLKVTCHVARIQANNAVDIFLGKIKKMLKEHIPVRAQGPLIANALSTAMHFKHDAR